MSDDSLPAILGGTPVRPEGPPEWPPFDAEISEALARAAADGSWGKYNGPHCQRLREALAAFHAAAEVILCSSGTVAIELCVAGIWYRRGRRSDPRGIRLQREFFGRARRRCAPGAG